MDFRELLKKYMEHVAACEGVTFLDHIEQYSDMPRFTDAEKAELSAIDRELFPPTESREEG